MGKASTTEKKCSTCQTVKPVSEFGRDRSRPDGINFRCRPCNKEQVKKRDYPRYEQIKKSRHLLKIKERRKVRIAVKNGAIVKQPCSQCGSAISFAHHPDYTKPLEVVWLCRQHHEDVHRMLREETAQDKDKEEV